MVDKILFIQNKYSTFASPLEQSVLWGLEI